MARTVAELPPGPRVTDYISLGVLAKTFPRARIDAGAGRDGQRASRRQRDLPAHVVVYYVIALALYMQASYREVLRCLLEGLQWLFGPAAAEGHRQVGHLASAHAAGVVPLQQLHDEVVGPIAAAETRGAWYRGWRLVALDGSTLDVADTRENVKAFGRPAASRGHERVSAGAPRVAGGERHARAVRHARSGRITRARRRWRNGGAARCGRACCAWPTAMFFGWALWRQARATGRGLAVADQAQRAARAVRRVLADGSYLSTVYASDRDRRRHQQRHGRARHRLSTGRRRRRGAALPTGDDASWIRPQAPAPGTGGALPRTLGDRDRAGRTEDPPARAPRSCCAARRRNWCGRSATVCCWRTSPSAA